jgi:CDP-diacylglycerol--serine O-phosphatidyltransferase
MQRKDSRSRIRRKGIYLLPNLCTTLGLFFGFYAVVMGMRGQFAQSAMAIFIAMIFDGLDGRVARMTNTSSEFGAEFDSLSDMVTFGIAPALLAYSWGLFALNKIGWLVAFMYVAASALRLARFNTQVGKVSKEYFQGLPCPAAAAVIAGMIWAGHNNFAIVGSHISVAVAVVTALLAILQVSNVPYYSFKEIDFKGRVPFVMILMFVLLCVAIAINPPIVLFFGFLIFTLSGPIMYLFGWGRRKKGYTPRTKKVTNKNKKG